MTKHKNKTDRLTSAERSKIMSEAAKRRWQKFRQAKNAPNGQATLEGLQQEIRIGFAVLNARLDDLRKDMYARTSTRPHK